MKKILIPLFSVLTLSIACFCGCVKNDSSDTTPLQPNNTVREYNVPAEQYETNPDFRYDPASPRQPKAPIAPHELTSDDDMENDENNECPDKNNKCRHHSKKRGPRRPMPEPVEPNN